MNSKQASRIQAWMEKGSYHEVKGHQIFAIHRPVKDRPHLVFLHGFPTCSYDFHQVLELLGSDTGYTAHDHLGFGLSSKPRKRSYTLSEQAEISIDLWRSLGIRSAHVVAHDYGTSVATELLALKEDGIEPVKLQSMVLSNGSILIEQASLRPIQRLLRNRLTGPITALLANYHTFKRNIEQVTTSRISETDLRILWSFLLHNRGKSCIPAISNYLDERRTFRGRWVQAFKNTSVPIMLLWGKNDPIAHEQLALSLQEERTGCDLHWLACGHYPMLEVAGQYTQIIRRFVF